MFRFIYSKLHHLTHNFEAIFTGILDSKAECRKESLFGRSSTSNQLFPRRKLLGGKNWRKKKKNYFSNIIYAIFLISLYFKWIQNLQLGIDIGSSTVARGVVSLVLGYLNNLVIEMAFLIQVKILFGMKVILLFTYTIVEFIHFYQFLI